VVTRIFLSYDIGGFRMNRFSALIALLLSFACLASAPVVAQPAPSPSPSSSVSPTPLAGFSARGTLSLTVNLANMPFPMGVNAEVAVMAKARRVRVDLLKFASTGAEKGSSAMVSHFLPAGAITVVYNQDTRTFVLWSEQNREYYQSKRSPTPKAKHPPKAAPAPEFPVNQIMKTLRSITEYDSFNETLSLVGHQLINGHTSSVYHMTLQSQRHGGKPLDISTDTAFADDLSGIPVRLWLVSKGEYDGALKIDLLSASTDVPNRTVFNVPTGFKKASSIMEIFAKAP